MYKNVKYIIGIFSICFVILASCKKDYSSSSASVVGTWKTDMVYVDTNHNGIMDPNELVKDTSLTHNFLIFNTNGTEIMTYDGATIQSNWKLINNNTYIEVSGPAQSGGTYYLYIQSLNSTTMVLKDTSKLHNDNVSWVSYTKQ